MAAGKPWPRHCRCALASCSPAAICSACNTSRIRRSVLTDAQIAYVRVSFDIMTDRARRSIWLVDVDSGLQTPVATGAGSSYSPRWSPDGKRLAYVSNGEGGRSQLFVRWMQTEQSARITDLTEAPSDLQWSPDGRLDRIPHADRR